MRVLNYSVNAGLGVIFPAKTFIIEGESDLYIISPGPLNEEMIKELRKSNKTINFISPNNFHNMYLSYAKDLFPNANFFGPKRSMKVSEVDLKPLNELKQSELKQIQIKGHKTLSETCFYNINTKELILTDLIFNMRHKMNFMSKTAFIMAGTYHRIGTSRLVKLGINNKEQFKQSLIELSKLDTTSIYLNHGSKLTPDEFKQHIDQLIL